MITTLMPLIPSSLPVDKRAVEKQQLQANAGLPKRVDADEFSGWGNKPPGWFSSPDSLKIAHQEERIAKYTGDDTNRDATQRSREGFRDGGSGGKSVGQTHRTQVAAKELKKSDAESLLGGILQHANERKDGRTDGEVDKALRQVFGKEGAGKALKQLLAGANRPEIVIASNEDLQGANGAYSRADGGTIYLNEQLFSQGTDPKLTKHVLAEELGHHIDAMLGGEDAAGDEGALFANVLYGGLSNEQISIEAKQRDRGLIEIGREKLEVEFNHNPGHSETIVDIVSKGAQDLRRMAQGARGTAFNLRSSAGFLRNTARIVRAMANSTGSSDLSKLATRMENTATYYEQQASWAERQATKIEEAASAAETRAIGLKTGKGDPKAILNEMAVANRQAAHNLRQVASTSRTLSNEARGFAAEIRAFVSGGALNNYVPTANNPSASDAAYLAEVRASKAETLATDAENTAFNAEVMATATENAAAGFAQKAQNSMGPAKVLPQNTPPEAQQKIPQPENPQTAVEPAPSSQPQQGKSFGRPLRLGSNGEGRGPILVRSAVPPEKVGSYDPSTNGLTSLPDGVTITAITETVKTGNIEVQYALGSNGKIYFHTKEGMRIEFESGQYVPRYGKWIDTGFPGTAKNFALGDINNFDSNVIIATGTDNKIYTYRHEYEYSEANSNKISPTSPWQGFLPSIETNRLFIYSGRLYSIGADKKLYIYNNELRIYEGKKISVGKWDVISNGGIVTDATEVNRNFFVIMDNKVYIIDDGKLKELPGFPSGTFPTIFVPREGPNKPVSVRGTDGAMYSYAEGTWNRLSSGRVLTGGEDKKQKFPIGEIFTLKVAEGVLVKAICEDQKHLKFRHVEGDTWALEGGLARNTLNPDSIELARRNPNDTFAVRPGQVSGRETVFLRFDDRDLVKPEVGDIFNLAIAGTVVQATSDNIKLLDKVKYNGSGTWTFASFTEEAKNLALNNPQDTFQIVPGKSITSLKFVIPARPEPGKIFKMFVDGVLVNAYTQNQKILKYLQYLGSQRWRPTQLTPESVNLIRDNPSATFVISSQTGNNTSASIDNTQAPARKPNTRRHEITPSPIEPAPIKPGKTIKIKLEGKDTFKLVVPDDESILKLLIIYLRDPGGNADYYVANPRAHLVDEVGSDTTATVSIRSADPNNPDELDALVFSSATSGIHPAVAQGTTAATQTPTNTQNKPKAGEFFQLFAGLNLFEVFTNDAEILNA